MGEFPPLTWAEWGNLKQMGDNSKNHINMCAGNMSRYEFKKNLQFQVVKVSYVGNEELQPYTAVPIIRITCNKTIINHLCGRYDTDCDQSSA